MTKPLVRIHNTQTDEVIDREMTAAEFKVWQVQQENLAIAKTQAKETATAKAQLLARLGITADEAKLLLA